MTLIKRKEKKNESNVFKKALETNRKADNISK